MQNPEFLGDELQSVQIEERDSSALPTPTPLPPTPTPFAPTDLSADGRPLAEVPVVDRTAYFNSPPSRQIDATRNYTANIQTSQGELVVRLYAAEAPAAVNNFVVLANLGFYDGLPVNEVAAEQFVVLGAPANEPSSDVGYSFQAELSAEIALDEGVIGFLPHQDPFTGVIDANGSQLFIALSPLPPQAAGQVAVFGQVVEGMEVLTALTGMDTIETITVAEE
jgi:cyclophilin family peptidyl-prolyl cis-trans isomerase